MIQSPAFDVLPNIRHGFFGRQGGVSTGLFASLNCGLGSGDRREHVEQNRQRVLKIIGRADASLNTVYQVHGNDVAEATGPWPTDPPRADGIVTTAPDVVLGILTADCAPVLLADAKAGVVGAAHCGWRGTLEGVAERVISRMNDLGAETARITAVVGPTIAQDSYEVGDDFKGRFEAADPDAAEFFASGSTGRAHFDLPRYVVQRLQKAGVQDALWIERNTYAEADTFFSFRRATHRNEADYGRQLSTISLVG